MKKHKCPYIIIDHEGNTRCPNDCGHYGQECCSFWVDNQLSLSIEKPEEKNAN